MLTHPKKIKLVFMLDVGLRILQCDNNSSMLMTKFNYFGGGNHGKDHKRAHFAYYE